MFKSTKPLLRLFSLLSFIIFPILFFNSEIFAQNADYFAPYRRQEAPQEYRIEPPINGLRQPTYPVRPVPEIVETGTGIDLRVKGIPTKSRIPFREKSLYTQAGAIGFAENILVNSAPIKGNLSTREILDQTFYAIKNDAVTSFENSNRYDPTHRLGLCFGRALAASLYARLHGAPLKSLQKILVTGPLTTNSRGITTQWSFHIATIMRIDDGWYTIDPIYQRPLPIENWVHSISSNWDLEGIAKFYIMSPLVFAPLDSSQIVSFQFSRRVSGGSELKPLHVLDHDLGAKQMLSLYQTDPHLIELTNPIYNDFFVHLLSNVNAYWQRQLQLAPRAEDLKSF